MAFRKLTVPATDIYLYVTQSLPYTVDLNDEGFLLLLLSLLLGHDTMLFYTRNDKD
jgi:hypothetical protein